MTKDEALAILKPLADEDGDPEIAHSMADTVLITLLAGLGYAEVVEAWRTVPKWYA